MNNCADDFEVIIDEPVTIKPNFNNIPNDFKEHPNWLLWKLELTSKGKWTKIPYQINGKKALSTNPATWTTFDTVKGVYEASGAYSGIGFAIGDSGLTCVDIDHEDNWNISDLRNIYKTLEGNYYKETSPSANGHHLWLNVIKPKDMGCKSKTFYNSLIEVYDKSRFITMTGNEPTGSIGECQEAFNLLFKPLMKDTKPTKPISVISTPYLDDKSILDIISFSNNSSKFHDLHYSESTGDASGNDQSYINLLAFYTGKDANQMDRIFRTSRLMRPKWDEKRGAYTYGELTINTALRDVNNVYTPSIMNEFDPIIEELDTTPDPFNVLSVDITKPHGLLGEICQELDNMAYRPLPISYPLAAMHIINAACGGRQGIDGIKINIITLCIALTGAGKDLGGKAIGQVSKSISRIKPFLGKPRSDRDLILNLLDGDAHCSYDIDEAHSLFDSIDSKNAQTYQSAMGAEILTMATKGLYGLSGNYKRELLPRYEKESERLNKKVESLDQTNLENNRLLEKLNELLDNNDKLIEWIKDGIPNPTVNMCMYSTPEKMDSIGCGGNIESGLMGRSLIWRDHGGRNQAVFKPKQSHLSKELLNKINGLNMHAIKPLEITKDASNMLFDMFNHYGQDKYINHITKGGLYARVIERVKTIASIMAMETGVVQVEDLLYGLAATLRHIDDVEFLRLKSLSNNSTDDLGNHVMDLIIKKIPTQGQAQSAIRQAVLASCKAAKDDEQKAKREKRKSIYDQALEFLITKGSVEKIKMRLFKA